MLAETTVARWAATLLRRAALIAVALAIIVPAGLARPEPAAAAAPKVVIVVGPVHASTDRFLSWARSYASLARQLGAEVVEVYTPEATWERVRRAAQGANIFIYLGHGNGWPSPYPPFQTITKDGLGLNPATGAGRTSPVRYYGESFVADQIRFAPGATVLLNHLCYASGNGEPGMAEPSWSVARQRVDNYAAGFIGAGAGAVLADGHTSLAYELRVLLGPSRSLLAAWRADPSYHGNERAFASVRRPGFTTYLDPDRPSSGFYRSLVTTPGFTTSGGSSAPLASSTSGLKATTGLNARLRSGPSTSTTALGTLWKGTTVTVTGQFVNDAWGRTWAPVQTSTGRRGYVAAWLVKVTGAAVATVNVKLRHTATIYGTDRGTIPRGTRVGVLGSMKDPGYGVWLKVRTPDGRYGWMAAWLMRP